MGDTTFYGRGKELILGREGVSATFGIGIVKFGRPLHEIRSEIVALQQQVECDTLLNTIPSVAKRVQRDGFFFHACKDSDDVRSIFLHYLRELDCEAEFVIARKNPSRFTRKHNGKDDEFYADILSHLIKRRLKRPQRMILNIAERGSSTRARILDQALEKAVGRASKRWESDELKGEVVFNVQTPSREPLLAVPDYLGWAIQRVFERGQTRYYDYLQDRIRLVVDLYDASRYQGSRNYYDRRNPLTTKNKIDPQIT
ncbi:hypothetical protein [Haloferula sp.]|uniref:hypothetical protein n=1 Tax=Haloferula sp. TaxID=2497595 RepID=UPI003C717E65